MVFFSSIKDNLTRGGVDVTIEAPENLLLSETPITIKITIINKKSEVRQVKKLAVKLTETQRTNSYNDSGRQDRYTTVLFAVENNESFQLNGNETKVLYLDLSTSPEDAAAENLLTDAVVNIANALSNSQGVNNDIKVTVDIEGIAIDPTDSQSVKLDKASKFNINSNWH